jgi:hypothetical protein
MNHKSIIDLFLSHLDGKQLYWHTLYKCIVQNGCINYR